MHATITQSNQASSPLSLYTSSSLFNVHWFAVTATPIALSASICSVQVEYIPGDGMKRNPERGDFAMQPAHSIHIRVTFHAVTRYKP